MDHSMLEFSIQDDTSSMLEFNDPTHNSKFRMTWNNLNETSENMRSGESWEKDTATNGTGVIQPMENKDEIEMIERDEDNQR